MGQYCVLKNLGFRYSPPWPRKHALFMTDFVAEAISKCTIHKPPLFFGFATCALAMPASRPMIRHSIYNEMHLNVRSAVRSYEEHASGKTTIRPELDACLKSLRKGDTLVVWRLDRLGRSLGDLIHLTTELRSRGVDFESLTERIETGSSAGKLIFHVFASLAEFERNLIRERTMAGLRAARARGRNGGRPRKLRIKDIQAIKALMTAGELPVQDIADRFGVSRSTLYRNGAGPASPKLLKTHAIQTTPASEI